MHRTILIFSIILTHLLCYSQNLSDDIAKALDEQNKEHDVTERQHIYYENTVSVYRKSPWITLCTNDRDTAAYYSEKSSKKSYYYRTLIDSTETPEYFEFSRENTEHDNYIFRSRIYKCSFFDPTTALLFDAGKQLSGTFNQRPITTDNFIKLVELLSNRDKEITTFTVNERIDEIEVIFYSVSTSTFEGSININERGKGGYTQYQLYQNIYTVNRSSGKVHFTNNLVKQSAKIN